LCSGRFWAEEASGFRFREDCGEVSQVPRGNEIPNRRLFQKAFRQRRGTSQQEALHFVAAKSPDGIHLGVGFDAFHDDAHVKIVRKSDQRFDHAPGVRVFQILDKGPADLERSERQLAQITQGGVSGAEVVDGERDAHSAELMHFPDCLLPGGEHDRFG